MDCDLSYKGTTEALRHMAIQSGEPVYLHTANIGVVHVRLTTAKQESSCMLFPTPKINMCS